MLSIRIHHTTHTDQRKQKRGISNQIIDMLIEKQMDNLLELNFNDNFVIKTKIDDRNIAIFGFITLDKIKGENVITIVITTVMSKEHTKTIYTRKDDVVFVA